MAIKQKLFSALSWRAEARADKLPAMAGQRLRNRCGHLMGWSSAHSALPDIQHRAAILCFHGIRDGRGDPEVQSAELKVSDFRRLLSVLKKSFHPLALPEMLEAMQEGDTLPPRSIAITFDDGYANNYYLAANILDGLNLPWSAFLPAGLIENAGRQWIDDVRMLMHHGSRRELRFSWGGEDLHFELRTRLQKRHAVQCIIHQLRYAQEHIRRQRLSDLFAQYSSHELQALRERFDNFAPMTWDQARELKAAGVEIGNHSLSHVALSQQAPEDLQKEIFESRDLLNARLGEHSPYFSYPYGRPEALSSKVEKVLVDAGYGGGLTLEQNTIDCTCPNLLQLPRLIVSTEIGRVLFSLWQRFIR
jgi:peptidoglycan/xylan/chitin deacetylase (PgdA/CDA1 family)